RCSTTRPRTATWPPERRPGRPRRAKIRPIWGVGRKRGAVRIAAPRPTRHGMPLLGRPARRARPFVKTLYALAPRPAGYSTTVRSSPQSTSAASLVPERPTLSGLRDAAVGCQACDLWRTGTQTVFGEGAAGSRVMMVGEQPGDKEDLSGRPFVGPAGKLLDRALDDAGIDRDKVYLTNVVNDFKWRPRGKRRIHQKPDWADM